MNRTNRGPNGRSHSVMQRTTMLIPDDLHHRLQQIAVEREVSMATIVREALEESVARARPTPRSLGVGNSRSTDTALRTAAQRPELRACR
jgi:hypothetical protein